jgi:hypothetical protein
VTPRARRWVFEQHSGWCGLAAHLYNIPTVGKTNRFTGRFDQANAPVRSASTWLLCRHFALLTQKKGSSRVSTDVLVDGLKGSCLFFS